MIILNLYRPNGTLVAAGLTDFLSIDYQRSENEIGAFEIILPIHYLDFGIGRDWIWEIYREAIPGQVVLDGETIWFTRRIEIVTEAQESSIIVSGHDTMGLLKRRIVAWQSIADQAEGGNNQAYKTRPADDAIREVFIENFGSGVGEADIAPAQKIPSPPATVYEEPDIGIPFTVSDRVMVQVQEEDVQNLDEPAAPIIVQEIQLQNALEAMQSIARESAQRGTKIIFDIAYVPGQGAVLGDLLFRVWVTQRGTKQPGIQIGPDYGNLIDARFVTDYTDECTWAYVGGSTEHPTRIIASIVDPELTRANPWYPSECFVDLPDLTNRADITVDITVSITDAAVGAPTFPAGSPISVAVHEGFTFVTGVVASGETAPTYTIVGGADAGDFQVNSSTGVLRFAVAPDTGAPTDSDLNNLYHVIVRATNGSGTADQLINVTVNDLDGSLPTFPSSGVLDVNIPENVRFVASMIQGDDPLGTYQIIGGTDAARFQINADGNDGLLVFVITPNFELPDDSDANNTYQVQVRYENSEGDVGQAFVGAGAAAIYENRTKFVLSGNVLQTPTEAFGVHYHYGDLIDVNAFGHEFEAAISKYQVHADTGGIEITIPFESTERVPV
jgi:hypothetical protein